MARQNLFENWHGYSAEIPCGSKISSKSLYLARFSRYKHFCVLQFCEKFENSKWPPFFARNFLFENWHGYPADIPCGPKILSKSLYLAGFLRYKHFCVLQFLRKIRKFKMAAIFGETKFFYQNWDNYSAEIPCGSKISSKSLYLARFSRYKHFCVLQFLRKFRKFKMAAIFGETKFFSKLGKVLRRDTLWVKNFVEIALSSTVFCNFCENFENSKWLPFWARQKFFENWENYSAEIPCGSKILSKSLYLAQFSSRAASEPENAPRFLVL